MTIRRIIALAISFILTFSLISCDSSHNSQGSSDPHDQYPHPDQSQANGGNTGENEENEGISFCIVWLLDLGNERLGGREADFDEKQTKTKDKKKNNSNFLTY